jgi:hypothetical protein
MVNIKKSNTIEINASGFLTDVTDTSLTFEDEKTGSQELEFAILKDFIGKEIRLKISNKEPVV